MYFYKYFPHMNPPPKKKESRASRLIKLLAKIAITVLCLWYVSGKIDFAKAGEAIKNANWVYLFFALIAFVFSKTEQSTESIQQNGCSRFFIRNIIFLR